MATKIAYLSPDSQKSTVLGFCVESPKDVLRALYPGHMILRYGAIVHPFESELDDRGNMVSDQGLIIKEPKLAPGLTVVGSLSGLDLKIARLDQSMLRDPHQMERAFRNAIDRAMDYFEPDSGAHDKPVCYLDNYGQRIAEESQDPKYERRVQQLLDIMEIVFHAVNPTVKDLRELYEGKKSQVN